MPYTKENPPDKIKDLPIHAQHIWVEAYNSAYEQYDKDEAKANATAWAAVKKAGYEKDKDGKWVKQNADLEIIDSTENKSEIDGFISLKESAEMLDITNDIVEQELKQNHRIRVVVAKSGIGKTANVTIKDRKTGKEEKYKPYFTEQFIEKTSQPFNRLKMFLNHITEEEVKRSERNINRWVSTVTEPTLKQIKDGSLATVGWANIHDAEFEKKLMHSIFREEIGTSLDIIASGQIARMNGENLFMTKDLIKANYVDWTPDPNMGTGVFKQASFIQKRGDELMELETLTLEDLETKRPDLVVKIKDNAIAEVKPETLTKEKLETDYPHLVKEIKEAALKQTTDNTETLKTELNQTKQEITTMKIETALAKSDLRPEAQVRVRDSLTGKSFKDEAEFKTAIDNGIKTEKEYIGKINQSGKARSMNSGGEPTNDAVIALQKRLGTYKPETKQ